MGFFNWFSKRGKEPWDSALPWIRRDSIYEFIQSKVDPDKGTLPADVELPDLQNNTDELVWAAGALDGVRSHHGSGDSEQDIRTLVRALDSLSNDRSDRAAYEQLISDDPLSYIDDLLENIPRLWKMNREDLVSTARWLATQAPDRKAVKLGMALLGFSGMDSDVRILHTLGLHDEFTLFSAVALTNILESPESALYQLAKHVDGWGRIQAVERLAAFEIEDEAIRDWLVREGFKNSIMYEYLAYTCAVAGNLEAALAAETVDDNLLESAGSIIQALVDGGPTEDMNDYEDAPEVVDRYLYHLARKASQLKQFLVVHSLREFLSGQSPPKWTPEKASLLAAKCDEILDRPIWKQLVSENASTDDEQMLQEVNFAAHHLGVDLWSQHLNRLRESPLESGRWFTAMNWCNEDRIDILLELAMRSLPLEAIASGAADELGLGKKWEAHSCLDALLQDLNKYPGRGWDLIRYGLSSPVTRNRNMALRALMAWDKAAWPREVKSTLSQALANEPNDDTRETLSSILSGV